ncbi:hypothetical protein [Neomegalonema sp.]|uniref:hypothetical protein n=1 Tax=Neomegalonema sp. TaxID=2039713 RepID=UPI002622CFDC|nr:hypothetical protein [Neomegalonema sp.]MDD2869312.1 hypothetical protein [Neomegalonema sp.]
MSFVLHDERNELTNKLNSFWVHLPFSIAANNDVHLRHSGSNDGVGFRVAVLIDGDARTRPPPPTDTEVSAGSHQLTISHKDHGTLKFGDLIHEGRISVTRNGEWAELRLFRGVTTMLPTAYPEWIDTADWRRMPFPPDRDGNHWTRRFAFGGIDGAVCDASCVEENAHGDAVAVSLVRRMVSNTICAELMRIGALDGNGVDKMPKLELKTSAPSGIMSLPDMELLTGSAGFPADGYVMIAAGAFAAISADSMLSDWETVADSADAKRRLARIVWAPENMGQNDGRLLRKLNNTHDNSRSGAFEGRGMNTDPVEVLHVRAAGGGHIA